MSTAREYFTLTRAKDVMTRDVVTVFATQTMNTAAQPLRDHGVSGVPVVSSEARGFSVLRISANGAKAIRTVVKCFLT